MRQFSKIILDDSVDTTQNSDVIDSREIVSISFQSIFADSTAAGTFKLQMSNDITTKGTSGLPTFEPTNWTDVPNKSATITSGGSAVLTIDANSFAFLKAVFTPAAGVQTITPVADVGVKQVQTITAITDTGEKAVNTIVAVADVAGSLNSTYCLLSSVNLVTKAQKNFYLWLDNGTGVDPAIAGKTGIQVVYADNDTASTIGGLIRAALAALTNDFAITGATDTAIITNKAFGDVPAAVDGAAATGFGFSEDNEGVASNLNNTYFLISSVNLVTKAQKNFYVWMNVDSIGTDPLVASRTAVPVAFASGSTDSTIGGLLRAALNLSNDFTITGATTQAITTNKAAGLVTAIADGAAPTGFTLDDTTPGVDSNLNNTYFTISSQGDPTVNYAVWFNIDSIGTAPIIAGSPTLLEVTLSSGASAGTVGTDITTALDGTDDFAASGTTTVTVTNSGTGGTFIPAANGPGAASPEFTYAVTTGGTGDITVQAHGIGV